MNITQTKTKATAVAMLVALGLGAVGSTAVLAKESADSQDKAEVQAFLNDSASIMDAIKAAESDTGGKAMSAEFDNEDSQTGSYEVEVAMTDGTTKTVAVGFDNGTASVVAMQSDDLGSDAEGNEDAGEKGETDNN
tara:strand:+ start:2620 stop:3027 length:408 start_codon:yes stop_codon:yes gene_type:complete